MDLGLKDKVAIVLAASKGLGRASAEALAREGCRIAICARGKEALDAAAKDIRRRTRSPVLALAADVGKDSDRERFLKTVLKEFGAVHILVTNGGGPPPGPTLKLPEKAWLEAAESTLLMAVRWTLAVAPLMIRQKWGRIIHILSTSVKQPIDGVILSNTMRTGLLGFSKSMSRDLAPHNVLVNALCPGSHKTDRLKELAEVRSRASGTSVEEEWRKLTKEVPLGRLGEPEEFASVVAFLASQRASYVTGTAIQVDGGLCRGTF